MAMTKAMLKNGNTRALYYVGLECPLGSEPTLLAGITRVWPKLAAHSLSNQALLRGLADRKECRHG